MSSDQLRATFEAHYPLPLGVYWNQDHYCGSREVIGSFRNATKWAEMFRGFLCACKEFNHVD